MKYTLLFMVLALFLGCENVSTDTKCPEKLSLSKARTELNVCNAEKQVLVDDKKVCEAGKKVLESTLKLTRTEFDLAKNSIKELDYMVNSQQKIIDSLSKDIDSMGFTIFRVQEYTLKVDSVMNMIPRNPNTEHKALIEYLQNLKVLIR